MQLNTNDQYGNRRKHGFLFPPTFLFCPPSYFWLLLPTGWLVSKNDKQACFYILCLLIVVPWNHHPTVYALIIIHKTLPHTCVHQVFFLTYFSRILWSILNDLLYLRQQYLKHSMILLAFMLDAMKSSAGQDDEVCFLFG